MSNPGHLDRRDLEPDGAPGSPARDVPARGERISPLLHLQQTAGNAAVAALLGLRPSRPAHHVAVQRLVAGPDEEEATDEESPAEEPESDSGTGAVEAEVENQLAPDRVVDTLRLLLPAEEEELGDYELPDESITAQALAIQRQATPPGAGAQTAEAGEPAPPREGSAGDVVKAILPYLKPVLEALKADVLETLRRLSAGEAVATAVVTAPIVIGPLTQPGPRRLALDQLDGKDVTFGLIPNFKITPQISDGQLKGASATYDVAPLLRKAGIPW